MAPGVLVLLLAVVALVASGDDRLSFNSILAGEEKTSDALKHNKDKTLTFNSILAGEEKASDALKAKPLPFVAQDYCDICEDHTLCIYKGDGKACKKKIRSGLSVADQIEAVKAHNNDRRKVALGKQVGQPPAANMMELVWDAELAMVAQRWADQCIFGHDACRKVARFDSGQNVAYNVNVVRKGTEPFWTWAVDDWYSEVKDWKPDHIKNYRPIRETGHYTLMLWATVRYVGCGYSVYPHATKGNKYTKLYVCNYSPRGNVKRKPMYAVGKACSACPAGTYCKDGLCGTSNNTTQMISCPATPCPKNMICSKGMCVSMKSILQ